MSDIAITDDKIVFVGPISINGQYFVSVIEVFDFAGITAQPGFLDAHSQPYNAMDFVGNINLYRLDFLENHPSGNLWEFTHADARVVLP